jgi:predicted N-acetyltransferase YhbS
MAPSVTLRPLDSPADGVRIWNAACGPDLNFTARFMDYNLQAATGASQMGRVALVGAEPVGFVLASAVTGSPTGVGWIDVLAVRPEHQRRGVGSVLLHCAESWLLDSNCRRARLGGSLRPFAPGLPVELGNAGFFERRGYAFQRHEWDVARSLADYPTLPTASPPLETRPARAADVAALDDFLRRQFPGRWHFEFQEFLREGGRLADYFLAFSKDALAGFARLTFEDSERPIERCYMHRLVRPWGQLGPLGIAAEGRGKGLGAALIDAALRYLRQQGVNGCVIDWTDLLGFYAKFGFVSHRQYAIFMKPLASAANL